MNLNNLTYDFFNDDDTGKASDVMKSFCDNTEGWAYHEPDGYPTLKYRRIPYQMEDSSFAGIYITVSYDKYAGTKIIIDIDFPGIGYENEKLCSAIMEGIMKALHVFKVHSLNVLIHQGLPDNRTLNALNKFLENLNEKEKK